MSEKFETKNLKQVSGTGFVNFCDFNNKFARTSANQLNPTSGITSFM